MESNIEKFCTELASLNVSTDDLILQLYNLTDMIDNEKDISQTYESIFYFIENNPDADIGSPGPLIHLIEKFYPEYLPRLIQSLKTKPTNNTVYLLNRILNSSLPIEKREEYLLILVNVVNNKSIDQLVRDEAKEFYEYQTNKCN